MTTTDFSIDVTETDSGWVVVRTTDGERSEIATYSTEAKARFAAEQMEAGATRYDEAGAVSEHSED